MKTKSYVETSNEKEGERGEREDFWTKIHTLDV